jgi:hypothetical protein
MQADPTRPASAYATQNGTGFHVCPGVSLTELTMLEIVKAVFGLKNMCRAPGDAGLLAGFRQLVNETETKVYITLNGTTSAWPGSMTLVVSSILVMVMCIAGSLTHLVSSTMIEIEKKLKFKIV